MTTRYLACDLGAESGRLVLGVLEDGRLSLEEVHRFPNTPIATGESLQWDVDYLFKELTRGLKKASGRGPLASISTDSWGVDYLLFDKAGEVIPPTYHYRDPRTQESASRLLGQVSWETIFEETGIQFMPINTLFQLAAERPERLRGASCLLGVGDGFNYLLSGRPVAEESLASTTQIYSARSRKWSKRLMEEVALPEGLLPDVQPSGTRLGPLRPAIAQETGLTGMEVVASCSHDTASAVAAVPAANGRWAYVSSGTWSLMGVERQAPLMSAECRDLNFTNEIGYGGRIRLLKNIVGLWLVQECRRSWAENGQAYAYAELTHLAEQAAPFRSLIQPADPRFLAPHQMPEKIAQYCRETGQPVPETPGAVIRCALESLALLYRETLQQLEQVTGEKIEMVHIVGGGSHNHLLNQFTADALGCPVLTGPAEATAAGNVLVQAIALGELSSLEEARAVMRAATQLVQYLPKQRSMWQDAAGRFQNLQIKS